jgi:hypothetical protein
MPEFRELWDDRFEWIEPVAESRLGPIWRVWDWVQDSWAVALVVTPPTERADQAAAWLSQVGRPDDLSGWRAVNLDGELWALFLDPAESDQDPIYQRWGDLIEAGLVRATLPQAMVAPPAGDAAEPLPVVEVVQTLSPLTPAEPNLRSSQRPRSLVAQIVSARSALSARSATSAVSAASATSVPSASPLEAVSARLRAIAERAWAMAEASTISQHRDQTTSEPV